MGETLENHAARVLKSVRGDLPADAALRGYLVGRTTLGAIGKRSVSRAVFVYYRWRAWLDPKKSLQSQVVDALAQQSRFDRDPASVKTEALAARAVPQWLASEYALSAGFLRQLQGDPILWIRARRSTAAAVARELGSCSRPAFPAAIAAPAELAAWRYAGTSDLFKTPGFRAGAFEIQDLSSQLVGHACAPKPGETWWDACAGEGGKALHLSDLMDNKGLLWVSDRSARRLDQLRKRAARAGVFNYRAAPWSGRGPAPFRTPCDGVLVDAPCSGVGTWQRNPHARWTTQLSDVQELALVQRELLERAAGSVKVGGRLVYAVCTQTRSETAAVADAFESAHPGFEPAALPIAAGGAARLLLEPQDIHANGMFVASWRRAR